MVCITTSREFKKNIIMKKYFTTKARAVSARKQRDPFGSNGIRVYKMPKGSRHAGMFAVCTELEYLNTY